MQPNRSWKAVLLPITINAKLVERRDELGTFAFLQVQVNHSGLNGAMAKEYFYGMQVGARIEQVGGKRMPQAVGAVLALFEACLHHGLPDGHLHGTVAHRFAGYPSLKEAHFRAIGFVVAIEFRKQGFGQDGHPIFVNQPTFGIVSLKDIYTLVTGRWQFRVFKNPCN